MKYLRMFALALLGAVTAYLLFFVQPDEAARLDGRVVITYWEKWAGDDAAAMQRIVDEFNGTVGRRKGIYVQYLSMPNVDQKTLVATAAGVPPDVAGLWNTQVAQFAEINALEPLDDLAKQYGITADDWEPVSPVTGRLDAFEWRVPLATVQSRGDGLPALPVAPAQTSLAPNPGALRPSEGTF